jgi:hypothetical protein
VTALRAFLTGHRRCALLLLALALSLRALLPGGTMPVSDGAHGVRVLLCDGTGAAATKEIPLRSGHDHANTHPCPFSALATAALSGGDAISPPDVQSVRGALPEPPESSARHTEFERARPPQRAPPAFA